MSTPSLKIQAHGTPSSLVPGSIQNARNNNLEIFTIVQTIPANPEGDTPILQDIPLGGITQEDLNGKEIIGSSADFSNVTTQDISIGTGTTGVNVTNLLAAATYSVAAPTGTKGVPLRATLSTPVTGTGINVRSAAGATEFTLTLRLILRKL